MKNNWVQLKAKHMLVEDVNIITADKWSSYSVRAFVNKSTGEVKIFSTMMVEQRGINTILKELNKGAQSVKK